MQMHNNPYAQELARLSSPLFTNIYATRMRYIDTIATDQIRNQGLFSNGDAQYDATVRSQTVDNYLKISDMVHCYANQITFSLREPKDAKEICELCTQYLRYWAAIIHDSVYPLNVPLTDLITLDALAARCYAMSEVSHRQLINPLSGIGGAIELALISINSADPIIDKTVHRYPSMIETISTGLGNNRHTVVE